MCEPGYLYVQDLITKEVWQVLDCQVDIFRVIERTIYCIVDGNKILRTDYWNAPAVTIYTAESGDLGDIEIYNDYLFFTEDDCVMRLNLETGAAEAVATCDGVINLYPVDDDSIAWISSDGSEHLYRMDTATDELICFDTLLASQAMPVEVTTSLAASSQNTRAVDIPLYPSTQITFPLSEYPHGSYFTQNGLACTSHVGCNYKTPGNCKVYRSSIQCEGFAKYAYDKYSHRSASSPWPSTGDPHYSGGQIWSCPTDVELFFRALPYGSYLRLDRDLTDGNNGNHSIVTAGVTESAIIIYDANYAEYPNYCIVQMYSCTFSVYYERYECVTQRIVHSFTGTGIQNTSVNHVRMCAYSGCGGYIIEPHASSNPGINATCDACGYVGFMYGEH